MMCKPAKLQKSGSSLTPTVPITRCRVKSLAILVQKETILVEGVKLEEVRRRKSRMQATKAFFGMSKTSTIRTTSLLLVAVLVAW